MRIAMYCRVSTEQQMENYSISLQKERIAAYSKSRGWDDITEYVDGGFSGSNINRPALQQLQNDISLKKIDIVIVYRLDRLSRSQKDTLYLIEEVFLPQNVEFISVSETIDTSSPFGRAMIGILSVFAQLERETITERLKSGRYKMAKEEGLWAGGTDASPYGFKRLERGFLEPIDFEIEHVKRIFEEYCLLKSTSKVQTKLKSEGYPMLRPQRIISVLKNRIYLGEVSFGGEWFKGAHEAVISEEIFNQVQIINSKYRGKNFGKVKNTLFTGKIKCGCCGEPYVVYNVKSKLADGSFAKYVYLICKRRKLPAYYDDKCLNQTLTHDYLREFIVGAIINLNGQFKSPKKNKVNYSKLILQIDDKISKLLDLYLTGDINKTILDNKVQELNLEKLELIEKERSNNTPLMTDLLDKLLPNLHTLSNDDLRAVIDVLIKEIIIQPDDIEVIWNL